MSRGARHLPAKTDTQNRLVVIHNEAEAISKEIQQSGEVTPWQAHRLAYLISYVTLIMLKHCQTGET